MIDTLGLASGALASFSLVLLCTLVGRRLLVARQERGRADAEERLRPLALSLVEGEHSELPVLTERDARALAGLMTRYARQVSGDALARIAAFFERRGDVDRELARLRSRRSWQRASAAYSLGGMASDRAVSPLIDALSDSDRDVAAAAARSLGRLGVADAAQALVYALVQGRLPRASCAQALLAIGPQAVPRLRGVLAEAPAEVAVFAVDLIGLLGDASDAPQLVELLRDTSAELRAAAARALGRLGAKEAAPELRRALEDRIAFVRVNAAHAIGATGDRQAGPLLVELARTDSFDPAQAAAAALARVDPKLLEEVGGWLGAEMHLAQAADLAVVQS
jgi:HEAT repeat protein